MADAATGEVYAVNGEFVPSRGLPVVATLDAKDALWTALEEAGIRIPEEISLIGYDNTQLSDVCKAEVRAMAGKCASFSSSKGVGNMVN